MTWSTAIADLRVLLSDGPTDKLRAFKTMFGQQNGINTTFKTFEFRRITDFSASALAAPLGIYINGARQSPTAVIFDDLASGFFTLDPTLAVSATSADQLESTYYVQWFNDSELDGFLIRASNWLGFDDVYANIASGLKTAALKYGAHEAYQKLSLKYAENIAETYRTQDSPDDKRFEIVKAYQSAAKQALQDATKYRDDYYTRKGQALSPLFRSVSGRVVDIPPKG